MVEEASKKYDWLERTPKVGELVMKLRGIDEGREGKIIEVRDNGKLKVEIFGQAFNEESLKKQSIKNFEDSEGKQFTVGSKVVHKESGRTGTVLEKEIDKIKVKLEAYEEENKILKELDSNIFEPLSSPPTVEPQIEDSTANPQQAFNEQETTNTTSATVIEPTTTTSAVVKKPDAETNVAAILIGFVAFSVYFLLKKYFG